MSQRLKAVYHDGAFLPQEPCNLPEGSEVELIVQGPFVFPPEVEEPEERERALRMVVERMQHNPIPAGAPPLTREALHERR
jgi:predicted DNA-binding antitoxin AbrB/MazE fold protein